MRVDAVDRQLLALLAEDARLPVSGLAQRLGMARSTIQQRLARLESSGVIEGYTVRVRGHALGWVTAYVHVVVSPRQSDRVVSDLASFPEVRELHAVAGPVDLIVVARTPSTVEMDRLLDRVGRLPGIERTTSSIVLDTRLRRGELDPSPAAR
jgi:DNA-binding Lrp family transcriptional regulator